MQYALRGVINSFFDIFTIGESMNPILSYRLSTMQRYMLTYFDLAKWAVFKYWNLFIFGIFSVIILIYIIKYKQKFLIVIRKYFLEFFYLGLIGFGGILFIEMFIHFIGIERIFKYLIFFSILSFPLIIIIINKLKRKVLAKSLIVLILVIISVFSTFSLHSSPLKGEHGDQVLESEYSGMSWFFENRDSEIKAYEQKITQYRFFTAIYGNLNISTAKNVQHWRFADIPDHYNYAEYSLAGDIYKKDVYFIISELGNIYIKYLIPDKKDFWRWTPEDFIRLNSDETVNDVYYNRGIEIFLIRTEES
jgi:hypothetical protein